MILIKFNQVRCLLKALEIKHAVIISARSSNSFELVTEDKNGDMDFNQKISMLAFKAMAEQPGKKVVGSLRFSFTVMKLNFLSDRHR